jgi:hypothetical protein
MTEDRLSELLRAAVPDLGPALSGDVVLDKARRRRSLRRVATVSGAGLLAIAVAVPLALVRGDGSTASPTPAANAPELNLGTPVSVTLRPAPSSVLVQYRMTGGGGLGPSPGPDPILPSFAVRLYDDGTLISGLKVGHLDAKSVDEVKDAIVEAGLDQGGRDYGLPTNVAHGGQYVFEVPGVPLSGVTYGITVNGISSSDAALSPDQRSARAAALHVMQVLSSAASYAHESYTPTTYSRYSQLLAADPIDVAAYPAWTGSALDHGKSFGAAHCMAVADPKADAGFATGYVPGSTRIGDVAWYVKYDAVLPGETPCSIAPINSAIATNHPVTTVTPPTATETSSPSLVPVDPGGPAAGACAEPTTDVATVILNPDTPMPRCTKIRPGQKLRIVNGSNNFGQTGAEMTITLRGYSAVTLQPGEGHTYEQPLSEVLAPGYHRTGGGLYGDAELLVE